MVGLMAAIARSLRGLVVLGAVGSRRSCHIGKERDPGISLHMDLPVFWVTVTPLAKIQDAQA